MDLQARVDLSAQKLAVRIYFYVTIYCSLVKRSCAIKIEHILDSVPQSVYGTPRFYITFIITMIL